MRGALKLLGWFCLAAAIGALAADLWRAASAGGWAHLPVGGYLYQLDPGLLPRLKARAEAVGAWALVRTVLNAPLWALLAPLGGLMLAAAYAGRARPTPPDRGGPRSTSGPSASI